ncbi:hypothetical protein H2198_005311 [Neophaeococcomyces mojaviensis]|uniref:Uncharacterized protein n=1 Tax=Neophaeococcomyces mojaviensis TaxID=3383035 RepID=A0ACC3A685_9EURO|nr:hypothetical protein H2198_005311 [Knufia sp. JES_112]
MDQIYSRAVRTIVWLGLSREDCEALPRLEHVLNSPPETREFETWKTAYGGTQTKDYLEELGERWPATRDELISTIAMDNMFGDPDFDLHSGWNVTAWEDLMSCWNCLFNHDGLLLRLALSEYWQRAWIVQELILSSRVEVITPSHSINIIKLLPLCLEICSYLRRSCEPDSKEATTLYKTQHDIFSLTRELKNLKQQQQRVEPHFIHFALAIRLTASRLCSDIRDRVFSIVSLVKFGKTFKTDYNQTVSDLLANVVLFHIRTRGTDLLIGAILPELLARTASTLLVQAPTPDTLPDILTYLNVHSDVSSIVQNHFWAKAAPHEDERLVPDQDFSCSFCLPVNICGREGIFEFWWRHEKMVKCCREVFWWAKKDGCWTSKVAGIDPEDLD